MPDKGQNFASVATVRAAAFDLLDRGWLVCGEADTDAANVERTEFVDALIARIAELQRPPHDGVRLENLCPRHKLEVLPFPTVPVCVECSKEQKAKATS